MTNDNPPSSEMPTEKSENIRKRTYAEGTPELAMLYEIFGEDEGCCTTGSMWRELDEAKIGDLVNISTDEGKFWAVEVIGRTEYIIHLKNEYVRLVISLKTNRMWNIYEKESYSAHIEDLPRKIIRDDIIEFLNFKDDYKTHHILRLISLHLNRMTDEQKDKLADAIWDIQCPGMPKLKKVKND